MLEHQKTMRHLLRLPSWSLCFIAACGLFLLQVFPVTGIFLMLFGGALWTGLIFQLGFILIAVAVLQRRLHPAMMVFPILWFGSYVVATSLSHVQARAQVNDITAPQILVDKSHGEKSPPVRFSGQYSYPIEPPFEYILSNYDVSQVFYENRGTTWSAQLVGSKCPDASPRPSTKFDQIEYSKAVDVKIDHLRNGLGTSYSYADGLCEVRHPQMPTNPTIVITSTIIHEDTGLLAGRAQNVTIRTPAGVAATIKRSEMAPLTWLPVPFAGCMLDSGRPAWSCSAGFTHEKVMHANAPNPVELALTALGIRKASLKERFPAAGWSR